MIQSILTTKEEGDKCAYIKFKIRKHTINKKTNWKKSCNLCDQQLVLFQYTSKINNSKEKIKDTNSQEKIYKVQ